MIDLLGFGLALDGAIDPHWTLATSSDPANLGPYARVINTAALNPLWAVAPPGSRWIGPVAAGSHVGGPYVYKMLFNFPAATGLITGFVASDDSFNLKLNGVSIVAVGSNAWTPLTAFSISSGFVVGTNTLEVDVTELGFVSTGLLVQITSATSP